MWRIWRSALPVRLAGVTSQEPQLTIDANTVIAVQRERLEALTWENTMLEARCRQAEAQLAELTKASPGG